MLNRTAFMLDKITDPSQRPLKPEAGAVMAVTMIAAVFIVAAIVTALYFAVSRKEQKKINSRTDQQNKHIENGNKE